MAWNSSSGIWQVGFEATWPEIKLVAELCNAEVSLTFAPGFDGKATNKELFDKAAKKLVGA